MQYKRRGDADGASYAFVVGVIMGFGCGVFLLSTVRGCQVRNDAIEAGVARWTISPNTGERQMVWLKPDGTEMPWERFGN